MNENRVFSDRVESPSQRILNLYKKYTNVTSLPVDSSYLSPRNIIDDNSSKL